MTDQQKDALTNKIMVYITVAFGESILWYVVYSLLNSSLHTIGYITLLVCMVLCVILGFILLTRRQTLKSRNINSYIRTSFISAFLCLLMSLPFIFKTLNMIPILPKIPYVTSTLVSSLKCSSLTIIVGYIFFGIAVVFNMILIFKKTTNESKKTIKNH